MTAWSASALVLLGLIGWTLALITLMVVLRVGLVCRGRVAPNGFTPTNEHLSDFMQRLARAHANCLENFPLLGGLIIVALLTGHTAITDTLAFTALGARIAQSCIHLASGNQIATVARFTAFAIQLAIAYSWTIELALSAMPLA